MSDYSRNLFSFNFNSESSNSSEINICLVGCVNAGKSTILNAFFGQDYAQCKIKRTTMMPNKFIETNNKCEIDSFETINKTISNVNTQIYTQTQNNTKKFKLEDYGDELTFHVESMEMNLGKKNKICMYDIPGLNDARTKNVYYDYLRDNFHKFNIILFVVDIQSGLNTSDEMDILFFLIENINKHKTQSNKNICMLTIINKADNMQLNGQKLEVLGELGEMYEQTLNTIIQEFFKKKIEQNLLGCIPICGLDSHLYRMIRKFQDINKLTDENVLRIGINEEGSKFRKYNKQEQRKMVEEKIRNPNFVNDMLTLSGFFQVENALGRYIGTNGNSIVIENMLYEYNRIVELALDNLIPNIKKRIEILVKIAQLDNTKYEEEMKKIVKQTNTLIYRYINSIENPLSIKLFYDSKLINPLKSDPNITKYISKYIDLTKYPSYFFDRILDLVITEFSENQIPLSKLSYIELFENIVDLKQEIVDLVIDAIILNPRGTNTFYFVESNEVKLRPTYMTPQQIIKIIDKLKISTKFIDFLRFFMANMYSNLIKPEELVIKLLIFNGFGEIPLRQFIEDLRIEKTMIDTNKQIKMYRNGLGTNYQRENLFELYYIMKCRDLGDTENFLSHTKPITIDFSNII